MSDDKSNQLAKIQQLTIENAFTQPISTLDDQEIVGAWAVIDAIEKAIKERKDALREHLVKMTKAQGEDTDKGHKRADLGLATVTVEQHKNKNPDEDVVKKCLKEAGLSLEDAFTAVVEWKMDLSKVEFLVQGGRLPEDKIEASKKETTTMKVKSNPDLKDRLDGIKKQLLLK